MMFDPELIDSEDPPNILYPRPRHCISKHRAMTTTAILPETLPLQERAWGVGKGPVIDYSDAWKAYLQAINDPSAFKWLADKGTMLFNVDYWRAESISNHHNFMALIGECPNHYAVSAWDYSKPPPPPEENWHTWPENISKVICSNILGTHRNPGRGWDAYFPRLRKTPWLYVPKSKVELFAPSGWVGKVNGGINLNVRKWCLFTAEVKDVLKSGERFTILDYKPRGASVFAKISYVRDAMVRTGWIAVLVSRVPGERAFYTSWRLSTPGVIPPAA